MTGVRGGRRGAEKRGEKTKGEERMATSTTKGDDQPTDRANIGARFAIARNLFPCFVRFPTSTSVARWFGEPD